MAGETVITIVGNLTADPELRTTSAGAQVASFTIASSPTINRSSATNSRTAPEHIGSSSLRRIRNE